MGKIIFVNMGLKRFQKLSENMYVLGTVKFGYLIAMLYFTKMRIETNIKSGLIKSTKARI